MNLIRALSVVCCVVFVFGSTTQTYAQESTLEEGVIVNVSETFIERGVQHQKVDVQLTTGSFHGDIVPVTVPLSTNYWGILKNGDKIRVYQSAETNGEVIIELAEYDRQNGLFLIYIFIAVILFGILGTKGLKNLIPFIVLVVLFISGLLPQLLLHQFAYLFLILLVIVSVSLSVYIRMKDVLFTIVITLAVLITATSGVIISSGFAQLLHVLPVLNGADLLYFDFHDRTVGELFGIVVVVVSLGAMTNIAVQIAKYLKEDLSHKNMKISSLIREGSRIGQKAAAGELNNFGSVFLGLMLFPIVLVSLKYPSDFGFWNNAWIVGQIILAVGTIANILLLTPLVIVATSILLRFISKKLPLSQLSFKNLLKRGLK